MDFTSGEKRGLIVLILLLTLLCGLVFLLRTCGKNERIEFMEHTELNASEDADSIVHITTQQTKAGKSDAKKKNRSKKEKNKAKDGAKRNYREEFTD